MRPRALVVLERGSQWPDWVGAMDFDVSTLVQSDGEPRSAFFRRVGERIGRAPSPGFGLAVLAYNDETGEVVTGRRAMLARSLLAAVVGARGGQLILSASDTAASSSLRCELIGMADTLRDAITGTSASITVRFEPARVAHAKVIARPSTHRPSTRNESTPPGWAFALAAHAMTASD
jgi:hypothetical protein